MLVLVGVAEDHRENKPQSVGVLCAPSLCLLFNACYGFSVAAVLLLLPQSLGHAHHHDEPCTDEATAQVRSWWWMTPTHTQHHKERYQQQQQ